MCTHTFEMYCKMLFLPASPLLKRQNRTANVSRLMRVERVLSEQPAARQHSLILVTLLEKKKGLTALLQSDLKIKHHITHLAVTANKHQPPPVYNNNIAMRISLSSVALGLALWALLFAFHRS